jgi:hypothetical protein
MLAFVQSIIVFDALRNGLGKISVNVNDLQLIGRVSWKGMYPCLKLMIAAHILLPRAVPGIALSSKAVSAVPPPQIVRTRPEELSSNLQCRDGVYNAEWDWFCAS